MEAKFLEAWGKYLIAVAKGSESLEALSNMLNQKNDSLGSLPTPFWQIYNMNPPKKEQSVNDNAFFDVQEQFLKNFSEAIQAMGAVPRKDYDELQNKYNALEEKSRMQAQTIQELQTPLAANQFGTEKVWDGIAGVTRIQNDQVHRALDIFKKWFDKGKPI